MQTGADVPIKHVQENLRAVVCVEWSNQPTCWTGGLLAEDCLSGGGFEGDLIFASRFCNTLCRLSTLANLPGTFVRQTNCTSALN